MSIHLEINQILNKNIFFKDIKIFKDIFNNNNFYFSEVDFENDVYWYYIFNINKLNLVFTISLYGIYKDNQFIIDDYNIVEI